MAWFEAGIFGSMMRQVRLNFIREVTRDVSDSLLPVRDNSDAAPQAETISHVLRTQIRGDNNLSMGVSVDQERHKMA